MQFISIFICEIRQNRNQVQDIVSETFYDGISIYCNKIWIRLTFRNQQFVNLVSNLAGPRILRLRLYAKNRSFRTCDIIKYHKLRQT
jgi:hypothetical protein